MGRYTRSKISLQNYLLRILGISIILIIVVRCERVDFIVSHTTTATCFDLV